MEAYVQASSQKLEMEVGLFWRLEATSNDLDPDTDRAGFSKFW